HRVWHGDQAEGSFVTGGETLWHSGQQIAVLQDGADGHKVRHFQADGALDTGARHHTVHFPMARTGGHDPHVIIGAEAFQGQWLAGDGMILTAHAHIAMPELPALKEAGLQVRQQADGQIDTAVLQVFTEKGVGYIYRYQITIYISTGGNQSESGPACVASFIHGGLCDAAPTATGGRRHAASYCAAGRRPTSRFLRSSVPP